jgi:hypothetical protein
VGDGSAPPPPTPQRRSPGCAARWPRHPVTRCRRLHIRP